VLTPVSVVCWKWAPRAGYRSTYGPETVNTLRAMVRRWYPYPHRFICVTDDAVGIDSDIEIIPAWNDYADVPSPHGGKNPSCYRRLRLFHPEAAQWFGERYVSLDLDVVITGDLTSLWHRPEPAVFWGDTNPQPRSHYNGSMMLLSAGARPQVWSDFDPMTSPQKSLAARAWGSDQGWISYTLGGGEAKWKRKDGVYSFRNDLKSSPGLLPDNARVVVFHGRVDPWSDEAQRIPWVKEHYRCDSITQPSPANARQSGDAIRVSA
jgi:hypothetical protein